MNNTPKDNGDWEARFEGIKVDCLDAIQRALSYYRILGAEFGEIDVALEAFRSADKQLLKERVEALKDLRPGDNDYEHERLIGHNAALNAVLQVIVTV